MIQGDTTALFQALLKRNDRLEMENGLLLEVVRKYAPPGYAEAVLRHAEQMMSADSSKRYTN